MEGNHEIRLAFDQHPAVADRAGSASVLRPIGRVGSHGKVVAPCPQGSHAIRTGCLAFYDNGELHLFMQTIEDAEEIVTPCPIAATAD